jgi:hypothetical protein
MSNIAVRTVGKAAAERLNGGRPTPVRAFVAAAITGTAAAFVTYRALRGGGSGGE